MKDKYSAIVTSREPGRPELPADCEVVVFAGPSLRRTDVAELRKLAVRAGRTLSLRAPIRRNDLLDLADSATRYNVVIVDGEFGQRLAVSITEIRSVLKAGQPLTGASSMGALRAVECRTLGMTGSGWVYEQYLSGAINSDADVALLYDPDEYFHVTIPLVNLRWLLAEKFRSGTLSAEASATALRVAGLIHFRDRRPTVLLRRWRAELPAKAVGDLESEMSPELRDTWDRKRLDAIDAIRRALRARE